MVSTTSAITPELLGAAMAQAAVVNAARIKTHGDHLDCNAWWRGGDDLNVRIFPSRGTWKDIKLDDGGGARSFAERMGLSLREFIDKYGSLPATIRDQVLARARPAPKTDDGSSWWEPGDAARCWDAHVQHTSPERTAKMRQWLWQRRGIPATARIPSGIAPADARHVPGLEARLWVDGVLERGPAVMAPLRSLGGDDDGKVTGLVLRPANPSNPKFKTLNVKGIRSTPGAAPRVFGLHADREVEHVVLCEGAPDTWTVEALCAELAAPVLVIGANGVGQMPIIAKAIASWGIHVVATYHLDAGDAGGDSSERAIQSVATLRAAGGKAELFPWHRFAQALYGLGVLTHEVKDISDVAQLCSRSGVPWKSLAGAFADSAGVTP